MAEIASGKGRAAKPFMTSSGTAPGAIWQSNRDDSTSPSAQDFPKLKTAANHPSPAKGKTVAKIPAFVEPQLCRPLAKPPSGPGWAHEIKFDGYRMQLRIEAGTATLLTRKGLDWSEKFPEIVAAGAQAVRRHHRRRGGGPESHTACRTSPPCRRHLRARYP